MTVFKIGAVWCNSCNVMRPRWKEIEAENPWLETKYFEYDDHPELIDKYGIEEDVMPVFIFIGSDGTELARLTGEPSKNEILALIASYRDK
ncbi:MAG: Thioredoxin [candidate division WS6 bacterium OLB20]|uniref:Thioredoxin n=1 Tax=candidate division WS6 bacterium OLB20 TaxID=1617426 RepID=A0A136LWL3_9BACT|nr:MAG: Thioredoxin [candidate division WS6 bacterium OLB20]